jgi:hypothetical protein
VACGGDGDDAEVERSVGVYEATLREVVLVELPASPDDDLPVVYAMGADGEPIGAQVQAEVAKRLKDEAEVRFTDRRDDVVDVDETAEPVVDAEVLVMLGPVAEAGAEVDLDVVLYRSLDDERALVVGLAEQAAAWSVVSVTPPG